MRSIHATTSGRTDGSTSPVRAQKMGMSVDEVVAQVPKWMGMTTGKIIHPDEVAAIVLLLASERVPNAVGADWLLDGGMVKSV